MTVESIRRRVELARTHDGHEVTIVLPGEHISVTTKEAEAVCDLADRAYEAASHLRDRERADYADGYGNSSLLSGQLATELEDCLARLDGTGGGA